jgi:hypothetical protein
MQKEFDELQRAITRDELPRVKHPVEGGASIIATRIMLRETYAYHNGTYSALYHAAQCLRAAEAQAAFLTVKSARIQISFMLLRPQ